ncbi:hypothetical protein CMU94_01965 [Elizabethkingia anophelis]|nr:hypothetical protein [Elizabethkingia anophelis]
MGNIKNKDIVKDLNPDDQIMLTRDGCVKKIKYEDLEKEVISLKIEDSLTSDDPQKILSARQGKVLNEKINDVKAGNVNDGSIELSKFSEQALNYIGSGGSNNPDYEDITSAFEAGINVLKLNNRTYNPSDFSGYGFKLLRKNKVGGKNILQQSDFVPNTVIEIRYDFDLNGNTINLPENIILKFNGGSINNGVLVGNNTKILAGLVKIFENIIVSGLFNIDVSYPEWFGAKSIPIIIDTELVNGIEDFDVKVIDSAPAINKALKLAELGGHVCVITSGAYKIKSTINIGDNVTLQINTKAVIYPILHGSGKLEETEERVYALNTNQYYPTQFMAKAIEMGVTSRITGRGWMSLRMCDFTIGIYLKGMNFGWTDMTYSPKVDIRIVGGGVWSKFPDSDFIMGDGIPSNDLGVDDNLYFDKLSYENTGRGISYWKGAGVWNQLGTAVCLGNTSFRAEADGNDVRIISMDMSLWDIYGHRGVEIVAINGGWINDSKWSGTVSNKLSNFISFYGAGAKLHHDMSAMDYQTDNFMMGECRVIYAEGDTGQNELGYTWDLDYLGYIRDLIKYEFREGTYLNFFPHEYGGIKARYIKNEGSDNSFGLSSYRPSLGDIGYSRYSEMFPSGNSPLTNNEGLMYVIPSANPIISDIHNKINTEGFLDSIEKLYKYPSNIFTDDKKYNSVIDTSNGIYGTGLRLWNVDGDYLSGRCYFRLDYYYLNLPSDAKINVAIMSNFGTIMDVSLGRATNGTFDSRVFDLTGAGQGIINIMFYIKGDPGINPDIKLNLLRFQVYSDIQIANSRINVNNKYTYVPSLYGRYNPINPNQATLQAIPRGSEGSVFYSKTHDTYLINKGKAENPNWIPVYMDSYKSYNGFKYRSPLSYYNITDPTGTVIRKISYTNPSITLDSILTDVLDTSKNGESLPQEWFDEQPDTSVRLLESSSSIYGAGFGIDIGASSLKSSNNILLIEFRSDWNNLKLKAKSRVEITNYSTYEQDFDIVTPQSVNGEYVSGFIVIPISYTANYQPIYRVGVGFILNEGSFLDIINVKLIQEGHYNSQIRNINYGEDNIKPDSAPKGAIYYNTTFNVGQINTGTSSNPIWKNLSIPENGSWDIPPNNVITAILAYYSKIDKQVSLSGICNVDIANVDVSITLPFTPDYGCVFDTGDLVITINTNSTTAKINAKNTGQNKTFQINYKTA